LSITGIKNETQEKRGKSFDLLVHCICLLFVGCWLMFDVCLQKTENINQQPTNKS